MTLIVLSLIALFSPDQGQLVEIQMANVEVDEWEIAVGRLILQEVIGRGAFGAVWRALLSEPDKRPGNRTVAAKCFIRKRQSMIVLHYHTNIDPLSLNCL